MRTLTLIAGFMLVAGCTPSNITHNLAADEESITMRQTGFDLVRANEVAAEHCEEFGKQAVLISYVGFASKLWRRRVRDGQGVDHRIQRHVASS